MKVIFEVEPTRNLQKFYKILDMLDACGYRHIEVPDAPLGIPKVSSIALAHVALEYGFQVTIHMRLRDFNWVGFVQLINAAYILGIREVVFLRGDPPRDTIDVNAISSERAAEYVKSDRILRRMRIGLYISLRKSPEEVKQRLNFKHVDFFLANWFTPLNRKHIEIVESVHKRGLEFRAYAIFSSNPDMLRQRLRGQHVHDLTTIGEIIDEYSKSGVDAVVVTAPGEQEKLIQVLCGARV